MLRILHLDDDPMMHLKTETALTENRFGLDISYAPVATVEEFYEQMPVVKPDLVLLDIRISGPDGGIEVLSKIKESGYEGRYISGIDFLQTDIPNFRGF